MKIQWTNKFSGEQGYVASISKEEKHFNSTFKKSEAKRYKTLSAAQKAIDTLISYGEGDNNVFSVI